jgi:repressor LexA
MITKRQRDTLDFIRDYFQKLGYAPTLTEIADGLHIQSKSTAERNVAALLSAGYLQKTSDARRNLELTEQAFNNNVYPLFRKRIPLLGKIAAGKPIAAIEENDATDLSEIIHGENLFMLKVEGDSMIDDGILDGDWVICESRQTASNGDVVVALIEAQEATLKRLEWLPPNKIALRPANSEMKPMIYPASKVQIQGVLKWQLRTF